MNTRQPRRLNCLPHQRQRVAHRAGIGERPEVARAVVLLDAGEGEVRDRVVQVDLQHQEALVVAEADVVARVEFLDQLAFEQQRLRLALHHVNVEIVDRLDQRVELQVPAHPPRRMKILAHALAQIARLADVDDRAEAVLVQIHARLVRDLAQLFADVIGHWHRWEVTGCRLKVASGLRISHRYRMRGRCFHQFDIGTQFRRGCPFCRILCLG